MAGSGFVSLGSVERLVSGPGGVCAEPLVESGRPRVEADSGCIGGVLVADVLAAVAANRGDLGATCVQFGDAELAPRDVTVALVYASTVTGDDPVGRLVALAEASEGAVVWDEKDRQLVREAAEVVGDIWYDGLLPPRHGGPSPVPRRGGLPGDRVPEASAAADDATKQQTVVTGKALAGLTPGPWHVTDRGIGFEVGSSSRNPVNDQFRQTFTRPDAEFIAAARNFRHAIENGEEPELNDVRALFPWMHDHTDEALTGWIESAVLSPEAFQRIADEQEIEELQHATPATNNETDDVGDDGLTDTERAACAQRYRDATSLTTEQIQKARQVLSDQREAILQEAKRLASNEQDRQEAARVLADIDALDCDAEPLDDESGPAAQFHADLDLACKVTDKYRTTLQALASDATPDRTPHPGDMTGSLKGKITFPDDPDAAWVVLKYDPSIEPEELERLIDILGRKPLHKRSLGVGPGWWRLVLDCHEELLQICPDYEISRIKQRLGGLKYYVTTPDDFEDQQELMQEIINRYERRSRFICEDTGHPGVLMEQTGSVATLNPKTAAPEWRVSTHPPLTTPAAIKECPGAIDRLLNDLFHDTAREVDARTARHFTRQRNDRDDNTD